MAFTASNGRTQIALSDINITPLVDVVLVLLIIFMVTAPVLQSGIEVAVPKTRTVKEITEERLVISIDKQQRVFLGNDPININEIGSLPRKTRCCLSILITRRSSVISFTVRVLGTATSIPDCRTGAVTMKMMSKTRTTSTSGVILM